MLSRGGGEASFSVVVFPSLRESAIRSAVRLILAISCGAVVVLLRAVPAGALPHTVQPGETLSGIAAYYDVDMEALAASNGIEDPDRLYAGEELLIPTSVQPGPGRVTYTVEPGDTLSLVAIAHGVTLNALIEANDLANPDIIVAGQVLLIPAPAPRAVLVSEAPRISRAKLSITGSRMKSVPAV